MWDTSKFIHPGGKASLPLHSLRRSLTRFTRRIISFPTFLFLFFLIRFYFHFPTATTQSSQLSSGILLLPLSLSVSLCQDDHFTGTVLMALELGKWPKGTFLFSWRLRRAQPRLCPYTVSVLLCPAPRAGDEIIISGRDLSFGHSENVSPSSHPNAFCRCRRGGVAEALSAALGLEALRRRGRDQPSSSVQPQRAEGSGVRAAPRTPELSS